MRTKPALTQALASHTADAAAVLSLLGSGWRFQINDHGSEFCHGDRQGVVILHSGIYQFGTLASIGAPEISAPAEFAARRLLRSVDAVLQAAQSAQVPWRQILDARWVPNPATRGAACPEPKMKQAPSEPAMAL